MKSLKYTAGAVLALALFAACQDATTSSTAPSVAPEAAVSSNVAASPYVAEDLGTLPGGVQSVGYAINGNGDIAGTSEVAGGKAHPTLWIGKTPKDLGIPWGTFANAYGVNNARTVVGYASSGVQNVGFIWKNNAFTLIKVGTAPLVQATAINNSDVVTGHFRTSTSPQQMHAMRYTTGGGVVDIHPGPAYKESLAWSINDQGVIVGSVLLLNGQRHAAQWSASNAFTDLGTLGGNYGEAAAVNNGGDVIGFAKKTGSAAIIPFVQWNGSAMSVLAPVGEVSGISDKGRIVGSYNAFGMTRKGSTGAFVQLPGFVGGPVGNGLAYAVNTCGTVTGNLSVAFRVFHAVRWNISPCD